jgi:hypothetical protein
MIQFEWKWEDTIVPASVALTRSIVILAMSTVDSGHTIANIADERGVGVGTRALMLTKLSNSARIGGDVAGFSDIGGTGTQGSKQVVRC